MGVPHLTTHLRPFATSTDLTGQNVVVDGPGLAYHVWYICLSSMQMARNPFEAAPSYRLLGETAIRWLDEIQIHNICLKKVLFDGFLPASKRPTRITRITGYTKQITNYCQAWPQMFSASHGDTSLQLKEVRLFKTDAQTSHFTRLPAAPFLVPAIIEALTHCERYTNLVEVVPGEADLYCADYVKNHGGVVVTGDSDLLLYDLGDGGVCFFKDIDVTTSTASPHMTCVRYDLREIARRLGLDQIQGLLALGFEMAMDAHASFRELLQRAVKLNAIKAHRSAYEVFAIEYKALHNGVRVPESSNSGNDVYRSSLSYLLKTIDPRVSEFVLQFSQFREAAGLPIACEPHSFNNQIQIDFFLPFLLDNPLCRSAWEMSTHIRQLAYGLINLVLPPGDNILKVTEYRRLQHGSRGKELQVPNAEDVPRACVDLRDLLENVHISLPSYPERDIWRALAIYQDQELHLGSTRAALSSTQIERSNSGKSALSKLSWDAIHLSAQFQGSYYSFRIFKQILSTVLTRVGNQPALLALKQLDAVLRSLPRLDELPPVFDAVHKIGDSDDQMMLKVVQGHLNILPVAEVREGESKKNRKKRKTVNASETSKHAKKVSRQHGENNQEYSSFSRERVSEPCFKNAF